jgi:hypothetical protein
MRVHEMRSTQLCHNLCTWQEFNASLSLELLCNSCTDVSVPADRHDGDNSALKESKSMVRSVGIERGEGLIRDLIEDMT